MAWPNPNDYAGAVQNPSSSFSDPDLRAGKAVVDRYGIPRPIAGNFATVFTIEGRGRRWAIRCFQHEVTDQQQRYAAITAHLQNRALPFMVGFEYIRDGIRVNGKWYPILKMDWTQGATLEQFIEDHLGSPETLLKLANRWLNVCRALRASEMAHGDLQHGNILITANEEIRLIDYDGMVLPSIVDLPPHEIGHRHYQHPTRDPASRFSLANYRNIDNFPAQVIGHSLYALSIDPSLWSKTKAGSENLLFRDSDYKAPGQSQTLRLLSRHADARIRAVALQMQNAIAARSFLQVDPYEHLAGGTATNVIGWVNDHVRPPAPASGVAVGVPGAAVRSGKGVFGGAAPNWLRDALAARTSDLLDFPDEFVEAERDYLASSFPFGRWRVLRGVFRLFAERAIAERFPRYPLAIEKAKIERKLERQKEFIAQLQTRLAEIPDSLDDPRLSAHPRVVDGERKLHDYVTLHNDTFEAERAEILALQKYIRLALLSHEIVANTVPGIGPARIAALNAAGVFCAADVITANYPLAAAKLEQVRNAVPAKDWALLEAWRDQIVADMRWGTTPFARAYTPAQISARYERTRADLQARIRDERNASTMLRILVLKEEKQRRESLNSQYDSAVIQVRECERELQRYAHITPAHLLDRVLEAQGGPP